ncbi:hypothetical protein [Dongshaea marina]|uniref:hypothetical protein n=1 Tax=Dongshaea marina TaxID=2047966 RepID=UPI00131EF560|nr:hypothetical protein [Dongshaea marina]
MIIGIASQRVKPEINYSIGSIYGENALVTYIPRDEKSLIKEARVHCMTLGAIL